MRNGHGWSGPVSSVASGYGAAEYRLHGIVRQVASDWHRQLDVDWPVVGNCSCTVVARLLLDVSTPSAHEGRAGTRTAPRIPFIKKKKLLPIVSLFYQVLHMMSRTSSALLLVAYERPIQHLAVQAKLLIAAHSRCCRHDSDPAYSL